MCNLDIDPCEVWSETEIQKARKEHRCDCCGGTIAIGTRYKRIFMVNDGYASNETECAACSLMMVLFKAVHHQWMSPSGMREVLQECFAEDSFFDDRDERVPLSVEGAWWKAALDAMNERREARIARRTV